MLARLFQFCRDRHFIEREGESGGDVMSRTPAPLSELRSLHLHGKGPDYRSVRFHSKNIRPLLLSTELQTLKLIGIDWGGTSVDTRSEAEEENRRDDRDDDGHNDFQLNHVVPGRPPRKLYTFPGSHPKMKSLSLCDNQSPHPYGVRNMLLAYPNLHTLVLKPSVRLERGSFDFSAYGTVLHDHARRLRRFEFEPDNVSDADFEGYDKGAIGSLRDKRTRLEQLRMSLAALLGPDLTERLDLFDYLPISLRWFWTTVPDFKSYAQVYSNALASMLDDGSEEATFRKHKGIAIFCYLTYEYKVDYPKGKWTQQEWECDDLGTEDDASDFASEARSFEDRSNTTTPLLQKNDPFLDLRVRSSPSCSSDSELGDQHGDCYPDPQHVKKEQDDLGNEDDATDFVQLGEGRC
ncbi:uncharacterized protein B0I36DRAFT_355932 [Microdochium trichocladiopsis]|uniref:Uncharacterized protein n=1 Tax=Microdochium trichocladiopsis TaxID=1682393 RepID=A0A9P8XT06_9PEZI|nr:uncharacterized protein B0I36DRAFT_355932 [Microdochium trichocladiopsis]KAH7012536.1 hypothetical protein B0I36DRAFT_355932 [Microdochium trichocladiopsis]